MEKQPFCPNSVFSNNRIRYFGRKNSVKRHLAQSVDWAKGTIGQSGNWFKKSTVKGLIVKAPTAQGTDCKAPTAKGLIAKASTESRGDWTKTPITPERDNVEGFAQ